VSFGNRAAQKLPSDIKVTVADFSSIWRG